MAITDARVLRSLQLSEKKGDKGSLQYSASEDLLVITSDKHPSFGDILDDQQTWTNLGNRRLPQVDDQVMLNGRRFYVTGRDLAYYKDNERAVQMTVRYDAKAAEGDEPPDPPQGTDPETWQRITVTSQQMTKPAIGWPTFGLVPGENEDGEGTGAQNSAGDPVDGLEEDVALVKLTYTNTQAVSPVFSELLRYTNRCNLHEFLGGPTYTVRMMGYSAEYDQKNNTWSVSVDFLYNPDGWQIKFYDAGFNENVGGERRAILDQVGNPVSKPVPLNGAGQAVALDPSPSAGQVPADLVERELYPYKIADMAALFANCGI